MFDPRKHVPKESESTGYLEDAGTYCVAFTKFVERGETANGVPFVKLYGRVVASDDDESQVGKMFDEQVYLSEACYPRIGGLCAAMGWIGGPFDLFDDRAFSEVFVGRPFKVKFKVKRGKKRNFVEMGFVQMTHSESEKRAMEMWVADRIASGKGQTYSNGEPAEVLPSSSNPFGDDEIPY